MNLRLSDVSQPRGAALIYQSARSLPADVPVTTYQRVLDVGGRKWLAQVHVSVPVTAMQAFAPLSVLISGLLASFTLSLYLLAMANRRRVIEAEVADRTHKWKEAQAMLRQREQELQRMARVSMMSELASGIGHELNQPLAAIHTYAEACLHQIDQNGRTLTQPRLREALHRIFEQAARCGRIIMHMRELTQVGEPCWSRTRVDELIGEVVELTRAEALATGVVISTDVADDLPLVLMGRVEIQQVLLNLVNNAIQAINRLEVRGERGHIDITARAAGGRWLQITVADDGPGVEEDELQRMFHPFYTTKSSGMGMGLSLCETIISHHEGSIHAKINDRGGLSVETLLPLDESSQSESSGSAQSAGPPPQNNETGGHSTATRN